MTMKRIRLNLIISMLILMVSLTGCWDRVEINDVALVAATGIDKVGDKYLVSIQIPLPGQMGGAGSSGGGGGTGGTGPWYVESAEGKTLREANEIQQTTLSRRLNFSHRRIILFGEEVAKEGLGTTIDILVRVPQNRLSALGAVVGGQARDILNADSPIEKFPAEMMRELAQGIITDNPTMKNLAEHMLKEGVDPLLPYFVMTETKPGPKGKPKTNIKAEGIAVFDQDKLAGVLKGDKASTLLLAMNQSPNPMIRVPSPAGDGLLDLRFEQIETNLKPKINGEHLKMKIQIDARGSLVENSSRYDITADKNLRKVEKLLRQKVESDTKKLVSELQHKLNSDPMAFGEAFHRSYPKQWKEMRQEWKKEHYPRVKVEVVANIHLEHTGSVTKPFGLKEGELIR